MADDPRLAAKEAAGRHAAHYVESGMRVGLGTGSTVHWTIVELGDRRARGALDVVCTATSVQTGELATSLGLKVVTPDEIGGLDVAIDGADEVDEAFNLTKGGGGAHAREKLVAQMSPRFVVVVDESKLVRRLGPFGTPLEVLDFAPAVVTSRVIAIGANDVTARNRRSDNGNLLLDAHFGSIDDPPGLARALEQIPGIVEHGIFLSPMVERVVVAGHDGRVRELVNDKR
ncbi:MAG: ribose-5-phosphate isomerase RpiA [Actinobacteria bacterium]|nr:ribose-5-phosphate isomerase RpiA [Actinomycetota bacterium]